VDEHRPVDFVDHVAAQLDNPARSSPEDCRHRLLVVSANGPSFIELRSRPIGRSREQRSHSCQSNPSLNMKWMKEKLVGPGDYIPNATSVEVIGEFQLRLSFDDGVVREVDLAHRVGGTGVFAPLKDPKYFAKVRVDPGLGTIVWPNGADLAPEFLHGDLEVTQ
jgi:hypothetical protein